MTFNPPRLYTLGNNVRKQCRGVLKVAVVGVVHFYVGLHFQQTIFAIVLWKSDRLARSENNNFIAFYVKQRYRSSNLKSVRCFNVEL